MAWIEITRRGYRRDGPRYASDLAGAEWALIEQLLPPAPPHGRPRETDLRSVRNAILYIASTVSSGVDCRKSFYPIRRAGLFLPMAAQRDLLEYQLCPGHGGARKD